MKTRAVTEFETEVECQAVDEINDKGEVKLNPWARLFADLMKIDGEKTKLTNKCVFSSDKWRHKNPCKDCLKDHSDLIECEYYIDKFDRKIRWLKKN